MKYIKKFENTETTHLTYDEVIELYKYDNDIVEYFLRNYPDEILRYYIPKYGRNLTKATLQKLKKLAKRKSDKTFLDMLNKRDEHIAFYLRNIEMIRNSKKYNL